MRASAELWKQLVEAFKDAERQADAALVEYEKISLAANEQQVQSPAEVAWEAASAAESAAEDRLLGVIAPGAEGVALQLRLFARRHHSVDLRTQPDAPEDREAAILRRIHAGLTSIDSVA